MITKHEVISNSHKVSNKERIYFLLDGDEIVYVGMSKSINERFLVHKHGKKFDGFSIFDVDEHSDCKEVESEIIFSMKPKYNAQITCLNRFTFTKEKPELADYFYISQQSRGRCLSERYYVRSCEPVKFKLTPFDPKQ